MFDRYKMATGVMCNQTADRIVAEWQALEVEGRTCEVDDSFDNLFDRKIPYMKQGYFQDKPELVALVKRMALLMINCE